MQQNPTDSHDFEQILRDAGLRITGQRKTILKMLVNAREHPDALGIYQKAKEADASVSLATVYRTLKVLQDKGAIRRHAFEGGASRFESADRPHHDHIVDVDTGEIVEFRSEQIEKLQEEIAGQLGYEIISHRLELYGRRRDPKRRSK